MKKESDRYLDEYIGQYDANRRQTKNFKDGSICSGRFIKQLKIQETVKSN